MSIVRKNVFSIKYLAVFVTILAIFSYKLVNNVSAQSMVSLSPSVTTTAPGQTITINLLINQVTDLWDAFFDLIYNSNIVEFITATDGGFLSSDGTPISVLASTSPQVNPDKRLTLGITRLGSGLAGVSTVSSKTIVGLQFRTVSAGATTLSFINSADATGIVDSNLNYITSTWTNGSVSVVDSTPPPVIPPSGGGGGGGGSITPPDSTPPARPTNFMATSADGSITLAWSNPIDSDFGGVLILRTESLITPSCPTAYNDSKAKEVYRGKAIEKVDVGLNNSLKYCYAIYAFDGIPNYTTPVSLTAQPGAGQLTTVATSTTETTIVDNQTGTTGGGTGLANAPGAVVDVVSLDEAHQIFDRNQFVDMTAVTIGIYNKIMSQAGAEYNNQEKRALANFIQNGTPNTRILGAGERGGSVGSFIAAFGRLPRSVADWQDVVKIGNGRWPKQNNAKAEAAAEIVFKKIYLHAPKRTTNKYEDNAIRIIAYGLRPAKRNMASEAAAIKSFKYIFKRAPSKSNDWDIIRAIAYSGAKR